MLADSHPLSLMRKRTFPTRSILWHRGTCLKCIEGCICLFNIYLYGMLN